MCVRVCCAPLFIISNTLINAYSLHRIGVKDRISIISCHLKSMYWRKVRWNWHSENLLGSHTICDCWTINTFNSCGCSVLPSIVKSKCFLLHILCCNFFFVQLNVIFFCNWFYKISRKKLKRRTCKYWTIPIYIQKIEKKTCTRTMNFLSYLSILLWIKNGCDQMRK